MSEHTGGQDRVSPRLPVDVTLAAVRIAGESFGYGCYPAPDRLVFPWQDHRVTAYVLGGYGVLADTPATLVLEGELRRDLDLAQANELAVTLNTWNQERLGPVLSFRLTDEGRISVRARSSVQIRVGLSEEQLADAVNQAMETTRLAVMTLVDDFPQLGYPEELVPEYHSGDGIAAADEDTSDPRFRADQAALKTPLPGAIPDAGTGSSPRPAVDAEPGAEEADTGRLAEFRDLFEYLDQPDDDTGTPPLFPHPGGEQPTVSPRHREPEPENSDDNTGEFPYPVTLDRVRAALTDLGVSRTRGDDEVIVAWVNDVLFGFFLDNGPSYLVKGHWDPNLDPDRDFMRVFLLCNDWNEGSVNTKAFCHADADGLQVRVEFTAPVGEGLNDAQLGHNTAVAINQVLHALDSISADATGESVVHWPPRDDN